MLQWMKGREGREWMVATALLAVHVGLIATVGRSTSVVWCELAVAAVLAVAAWRGRLGAWLPCCWGAAQMALLSEPAVGFGYAVWGMLPAMLWPVYTERRLGRLALMGLWTGLLMATGIYAWLWGAMQTFWEMAAWSTLPLFLVVCALIGMQLAIFFPLARWVWLGTADRLPLGLTGALVYVVVEYWMPLPMPIALGLAFTRQPWLLQLADLGGLHGVSLAVALASGGVFAAAQTWRRPGAWRWAGAVIGAAALGGQVLYGAWAWRHFAPAPSLPSLDVVLVQPVAPLKIMNDDHAAKQAVADRLVELTLAGVHEQPGAPDLIVWPEGTGPFASRSPKFGPEYAQAIERVQAATTATLVVQDIEFTRLTGDPRVRYYSTASMIKGNGSAVESYRKNILMPLSEYMPGERWMPWLRRLFPQTRSVLAGRDPQLLSGPRGVRFAPLICYEVLFPDYVRRLVRPGARYIVNLTNDRWYGAVQQPVQHQSFAQLRAIENRKPVVRCTNSGVSALIDARGWIAPGASTPLMQPAALRGRITPRAGGTFYGRWGDVPISRGLTALVLLVMVYVYIHNRPETEKPSWSGQQKN